MNRGGIESALRALTAAEGGADMSVDYAGIAQSHIWPDVAERDSDDPLLLKFESVMHTLYRCSREITELAKTLEAQR
jgi:hypothetical protein